MIKVTTRDGSELFLNCDLIEFITETPDTHITLSNGNRYLVLEPAKVIIGRMVSFKARLLRLGMAGGRRYLRRSKADNFHPQCGI